MKSASDRLRYAFAALVLAACGGDAAPAGDGASAASDPLRCATCHLPEFDATTHPPHLDARPTTCAVCHTQTSWHGVRVDHPGYALTGAHARTAVDPSLVGTEKQVKCYWCHRGDPATWRATKHDCLSCHGPDRASVREPDHSAFPETCESCHTTEAWKPATRSEPAEPKPVVTATAHPTSQPSPPKPSPSPSPTPKPAPTPKPRPSAPSPVPDVTTHASQHR